MELLARHTVDNRGTTRPALGQASRTGQLARATVVGGGPDGQVLRARQRPIRRADLPDPLPMRRLPPLRIGPLLPPRAERLRQRSPPRTRSVAGHRGVHWVIDNIDHQARRHRRAHPHPRTTARRAPRQSTGQHRLRVSDPPQGPTVRPGRVRPASPRRRAVTDNSPALRRARRQDSAMKRQRAVNAIASHGTYRRADQLPRRGPPGRGLGVTALRRRPACLPDRDRPRPPTPSRSGTGLAAPDPLARHRAKPARRPGQHQRTSAASHRRSRRPP